MIKLRVFDKRYHKYLPQHTIDNMILYELNSNDYIIELATGLTDKNGKDIYVGDIVDIHQTVNGQNLFIVTYVVKYCINMDKDFVNVKYALIDRDYEYDIKELLDFYEYDTEIEVIGNINENQGVRK